MEPIKLYAPEKYRESKLLTYTEILFPFWGVVTKETSPYARAASLQYQYSKNDFVLVEKIEDADYVLLPYQYDRFMSVNPAKVTMIIDEAQQAGKQILIDGTGDIERTISVPNSIILRLSQYRYARQPNEITVSYPAEDLLESFTDGTLLVRKKSKKPSISFAGWARLSSKSRIKLWIKELPITLAELFDKRRGAEHKGVLFRAKSLAVLTKNTRIEPHFIVRNSYSGHLKTMQGSVEGNRRVFVENLLDSDYALCVKGDGNVSVRFYEAISLGRIPLFVDTSCVLPLEDKINYRDFCVFIDWQDIDRIGDILADFHASISPEQFEFMQRNAREIFVSYLRSDVFSVQLASQLRGFIKK
jgi:hypothetical protein